MSNTIQNLFDFDVSHIYDLYDGHDVLSIYLEIHAACAFFLAGNDEMGLAEILDYWDITVEDYNPAVKYHAAVDYIYDEVNGYNYFVKAIGSDQPLLRVVVDEEKTSLLSDSDEFVIYRVVQE